MIPFERVLAMVGMEEAELSSWVENRWVRPEREGATYRFREVDVARIRLIVEIRHEMGLDDEAVPVVLSLLDQVYDLRRQLRLVCEAVNAQPAPVRDDILARIGAAAPDGG